LISFSAPQQQENLFQEQPVSVQQKLQLRSKSCIGSRLNNPPFLEDQLFENAESFQRNTVVDPEIACSLPCTMDLPTNNEDFKEKNMSMADSHQLHRGQGW
jgi:hypothetical protein